jgi:hypothetical protein
MTRRGCFFLIRMARLQMARLGWRDEPQRGLSNSKAKNEKGGKNHVRGFFELESEDGSGQAKTR